MLARLLSLFPLAVSGLAITSMATLPTLGQEVGSSSTPSSKVEKDDGQPNEVASIDVLTGQLSSADYATRELADEALRNAGIDAVEPLARCFRDTDDYEKRVRIQWIVEHIYFWDRVLGKNGFLGISHRNWRQSSYYNPKDVRIDPNEAAFVIMRVIEETSAFRAGLRVGDVIVAIDGVTLPADANPTAFADQIRYKLPGTKMIFKFWRGNESIEQEIHIGHRPLGYYLGGQSPPDLKKQYQTAVEEFPKWWTDRFGAWGSRVSSQYHMDHPQFLPLPQNYEKDR